MRPWDRLADSYRRSRALRWALELALLLGVLLAVDAFQTRQHARGAVPQLPLRSLEGAVVPFSNLLGQPLLLVVWAPWCGVCKLESGNVSRARGWLEPGVRVVSVAAAYRSVADVRGYMQQQGVDYPVLLGERGFEQALGVRAFPSMFVLDARGRVVRSTQGYTTTLGLFWRAKLF